MADRSRQLQLPVLVLERALLENLGCASQATLAAQVADPIDLVRSREEGRPDMVKRMGAIAKIREGRDPSTQYRQATPQINSTVGGSN